MNFESCIFPLQIKEFKTQKKYKVTRILLNYTNDVIVIKSQSVHSGININLVIKRSGCCKNPSSSFYGLNRLNTSKH